MQMPLQVKKKKREKEEKATMKYKILGYGQPCENSSTVVGCAFDIFWF